MCNEGNDMRKALTSIILLALPLTALGAEARSPFERKLLGASESQLAKLDEGQTQGLIELAAVNLPLEPKGENDHFGWPVATTVGDTIIAVHRAMPGHNRKLSGSADKDTTYSTIVRSTDGGQTWSEPYDVRQCMTVEDRNRGGSVPLCHRYKFDPDNDSPLGYKLHLNAIGPTRDGALMLVCDHGVFRSEDVGKTWRHLRLAFREDRHQGAFFFVGPRIIDDEELGLLVFGCPMVYRKRNPNDRTPSPSNEGILPRLAIYRSGDGGRSWEDVGIELPKWCIQAEPNVIVHDGAFFIMARNQSSRHLVQLRWKPGEPIQAKDTNMIGKGSVDTSDICYNPLTERFEVVASNRAKMSIELFSLAPAEWDTAKWRFEGRLFHRGGSFYSTADGFHTGGAIVDAQKSLQHIFFYCGHPGGPAGVFRITRTLDTPKLSAFLQAGGSGPATAENKQPEAKDIITLDVVPRTPQQPRNDHAMILPLKDGRLMLVWCEYYSSKPRGVRKRTQDYDACRISAKFSSDRGRSWTDESVVLQENIGGMNVKHPSMVRLASDEILFFFTVRNSHTDLQIYMKRSRDECKTWTKPVKVSSLAGINFKNSDHAFQMKSGRIIVPAFWGSRYGRGKDKPYEAFCYYSDDEGRTWNASKNRIRVPKVNIEEPTMVELKDGSILALLRNMKGTLLRSYSHDRGETWSEPISTGVKAPHSTSFVKRIAGTGDLLLIWNHNYDPKHHHGGIRNPLTAAISRDEGKTWQNFKDLENTPGDNDSTPAVCFVGDEALITYYRAVKNFGGSSGVRLKIVPVTWFYP